jgi:hypothetical protein
VELAKEGAGPEEREARRQKPWRLNGRAENQSGGGGQGALPARCQEGGPKPGPGQGERARNPKKARPEPGAPRRDEGRWEAEANAPPEVQEGGGRAEPGQSRRERNPKQSGARARGQATGGGGAGPPRELHSAPHLWPAHRLPRCRAPQRAHGSSTCETCRACSPCETADAFRARVPA